MDILLTILSATIVLGFLVFIHEGGHFLTARAFGVRVSEFMLGFPGPGLSFKRGETRFGVTCVPLGGYARVCGMEAGEQSPHLEKVLACVYEHGTMDLEDVAQACDISEDDAEDALVELVEWGSLTAPKRTDPYNTYRAVESPHYSKRALAKRQAAGLPEPPRYEEGQARPVEDAHALFESELSQQYCNLPFWKRCVILIAGPGVNVLFALLAFVLIYSVLGFDVQNQDTGEIQHITVDPLRAIQAGCAYLVMVVQAVINLFNPVTVGDTISNSTSVVGIAVMSKSAFEAGLVDALAFTAMISTSLGIMNLLPIPPLDGGRLVVEVIQKLRRKNVSVRAMNTATLIGMGLFMLLFVVMINQDVQRFIFGNW
ncbi:MAG: site-2 protease family protein [Coriobacteriia bacterium]|nr:site-2 protease family protein [Coriobacteriia bacterium]